MHTAEFLSRLRSLDIRLWAEGDRLRYDSPKGLMTEDLRREILGRKPEILAFLQKGTASARPQPPPLSRGSREADLSPSLAQQRLWFIDRLEGGSPLYKIAACARLSGPLDVGAFERSLTEIVRRHEILRTTFSTRNGKPLLRIAPRPALPFSLVDLSGIPSIHREDEALLLTRMEGERAFDLSQGPLLRVSLFRMDACEHILLATMHHIISDGWSVSVLMHELASLYKAFTRGQPSPLPEPSIQYADFAQWQRQWFQGEFLDSQLAYWKDRLGSIQPFLDLPTDRPRPPTQSFNGALEGFTLSADMSRSIRSLARQEGATLFMTLLAGFQALLYRHTGQENFAVGSPIASRPLVELESLIGLFANTLVFRAELSGDLTFRQTVQRVRDSALETYAHQDVPFDSLVNSLQPQRTLSHTPLFQTMFVLQNTPMGTLDMPGVTVIEMPLDLKTSIFDLTLSMSERGGLLQGAFEYNRDLFHAATIRRMIDRFQVMLESGLEDPDRSISRLSWLSPSERRQLQFEWNDTARVFPQGLFIHKSFEAQVERTPDAIAVVCGNHELTYHELNRRANQVAHYLQGQGIGPDTLVGLCVDRSLEMMIGLLGVLKAGGAYLPMDPSYPPERLGYMIEDSGVRVILTQEKLRGQRTEVGGRRSEVRDQQLPPTSNLKPPTILCLDTDWPMIEQESDANPGTDVDPSQLAYVIYTSGSTGRPKGTMVEHLGVANLTHALTDLFAMGPESRVLQFASIGFDASVTEFFPTFAVGGTLCLAPQEVLSSGPGLADLIREEAVSVVTLPPSLLSVLRSENLPVLRTLVSAGESCSWEIVSRWAPGRRFLNGYGPTETTVSASFYRAEEDRGKEIGGVPIGRPNPNTRIYIVDGDLQTRAIGVAGEILVGGICLARGYLGRPDLTAEKFIPDPFPLSANGEGSSGGRLYRTGDLARYLPDGNLEFLGRIDHQVKIRGFRIELGEIEAALIEHPAVEHAVAVAWGDAPAGRRVVAYVVPDPAREPSASGLRQFLKGRLPGYMVPSSFVILDRLPLNASGKVDRSALPVPDQVRPDTEVGYEAPRTPAEEAMARIWSDVLGVERIGIHDNFFELGGDSILSIQVAARANQEGLHFTPKELFLNPTVSTLAAVARAESAVSEEQGPVEGAVPLTPIQRWFFEQDFPDPNHWNQSVLLELTQSPSPGFLETAFEALLRHHDALRLRFVPPSSSCGPGMGKGKADWRQFNQGVGGSLPLARVDLSQLSEVGRHQALESCAGEIQASLDLDKGPIVRMAHFDLGAENHERLLIVVHHLAVDGVSWRVLMGDLQSALVQLGRDEDVRFPPKTTAYRDWALQLMEYSKQEQVRAEWSYWSMCCRENGRIPADYPNGENTVSSERIVSISLAQEETQVLLRDVSAAYGADMNDVLLAALACTVARWTGSQAVLVELEGHGREYVTEGVDVSRTVGWFTSSFPVLLKPPMGEGAGEILKTIKEQLRRVPAKGIGYGVLRYLTRDGEGPEQHGDWPQPQVGFNYLGRFDQTLPATGIFRLSSAPRGPERSPHGKRTRWLGIDGGIFEGVLHLDWSYSENLHKQTTIVSLTKAFTETLRALVEHCRSPEASGYTPSDFPDVELSPAEIEALGTEIREAGESMAGMGLVS